MCMRMMMRLYDGWVMCLIFYFYLKIVRLKQSIRLICLNDHVNIICLRKYIYSDIENFSVLFFLVKKTIFLLYLTTRLV